jgi:S-adenosylmethionine hydrolase
VVRGRGGASLITLTTDFGTIDPFVGIMKGVIAGRAPGVQVVDVSHGVPPQDVTAGALVLRAAAPYFPAGSVHVAVVDPGVGSARRPICVETRDACFVGPDNGLLSLAAPRDRILRIVEIADERFMLSPRSRTFHGRDVFAPAAAALASGTPAADLGPVRDDIIALHLPLPLRDGNVLRGEVVYVDRFGNLATNVDAALVVASVDHVEIGGHRAIPFVPTYATVERHALLALVNSWGLVEIAVRDGDARAMLGVGVGAHVLVVGA